ncbi:hypothetical protein [Streptomyces sp. 6N223]|uniref:hypothetical protein n=1 Tax=Streptomyces sp. 6N223 TaxID=3457412 RepID=UPI003FCF865C
MRATAERSETQHQDADAAQGEKLPSLERLTMRQQTGIDCALCGNRIGVHARYLGSVPDRRGNDVRLYGCAPACPLPHREPGTWWPAGRPPRPTRPPTPGA